MRWGMVQCKGIAQEGGGPSNNNELEGKGFRREGLKGGLWVRGWD